MIVFDNVTLRYQYDEFELLKGVSFSLIDGVNTILADTQSGKTSVCKLLIKEVAPTHGQIFVDDVDISSITNANLDILYLPRNPAFFERRSVLYNIEYPLRVRKVPKDERQKRVLEVATRLNLEDLNKKVKKLSDEERKTVALVRGLTVSRKTVLFDDFLDAANAEQIQQKIRLFDGATVVLITSDVELAMGNVVVLDGGKVVYQGDAEGARKTVADLHWLVNLRSI